MGNLLIFCNYADLALLRLLALWQLNVVEKHNLNFIV